MWLADRVATNRERIGVHYESDSVAGEKIAAKLATQLKDGAIPCASYHALLQKIADTEGVAGVRPVRVRPR